MRQMLFALPLACLAALPLAAQEPAEPPRESPQGTPVIPFLEEWSLRTEEMMRELMEEVGPDMQRMMAEIMPRLQELAETLGGLSNYEMPEVLPNGDIIIRRKSDAPPLPEDLPRDEGGVIDL
ncbi:AAA+ family ATPase [Halovulum dunhuangense]|uniref:AAA+ family ATPase n=1 Tax=Halovulum dunhuangense TaxID=1505036 RepID=A0A849L5V8_9RHOB|nr:AAA+ family ATPase [Halovulum dunhuangense]NNU81497.1 AAA+ family ATPase [Halovulum dunhuangense]